MTDREQGMQEADTRASFAAPGSGAPGTSSKRHPRCACLVAVAQPHSEVADRHHLCCEESQGATRRSRGERKHRCKRSGVWTAQARCSPMRQADPAVCVLQ